jgi:hypothetical protein
MSWPDFDDDPFDHGRSDHTGRHQHRVRYARWRGGPDPLAPPYDV